MASSAVVLEEIRTLTERRHRDPASVLLRVTELMADAHDPRVEAAGRLAAGLAMQEVGRIKDAVASFRLCVATSVGNGLTDEEALGRAQLAVALLNLGDATAAEQEVTRAREVAPASAQGVVEMLWGLILQRTGRLDDSLAAYRRSLRWLGRFGDDVSMGRVRMNRGIVLAYQGVLDAALDDFAFAERVAIAEHLPAMAAMAAHNMGFTLGRRGSLPDALAAFERAEKAYAALETPHRFLAVLQADRCDVLLLAGLVHDARSAAEAAVAALEKVDEVQLSECRLLLARTLLAEGAYPRAASEATTAARRFQALRRGPWAAQARYVALQAEVLALQDQGLPPPELLRRSRRIAVELEAQGWALEALHVRTFVGRIALALGRPAVARTELAQAAAARSRGTADLRAQAWHAAALLRIAEGDPAGAKRAVARGIAVVDEYRSTLGATELRANAASHGAELARLGVELAMADGRPAEILRWADRCRAGALHQVAVRPPPDESLAATLTALRRVRAELREASLGGTGSPEKLAQAADLEESVRNQTRQIRQDRAGEVGRVDVRALRRALGARQLVEYVTHEQRLFAVTVVRGRVHLHELGGVGQIAQEKDYLLFALRRLLMGRRRGGAAAVLAPTAAHVDDLLVAPLGLDADGPLVVVPTGLLHGLPWSCLPGLAGRDTTIAPSAAMWLGGDASAARAMEGAEPRVALVAGPQLPGAEAEIAQLRSLYPAAEVLVGPDATTANVLAAMERADVVHLAAHGDFRADSPLFSSLLLADGPLTVYDIERLQAVPRLVVLSACDAAVAEVRAGDELLGTAAALLGLGVRSVIAPVFAVPDDATTPFMVALHRRLLTGARPAAALAGAAPGQDPAAAAAFLCIGRDDGAEIHQSPAEAWPTHRGARAGLTNHSGEGSYHGLVTGPLDDWTTSDLVLGARKGDADAWDALVARFAGRVRAVIRSYRVSGADADDVFQVTWLRLVANLEQIRDPERVGAWLATTAGHECLRIIRRSGRHATPDEGWEETLVSDAADVDSEVLVAEREQALWKAMGEVSAQCQRLLGILASDPAPSYEEVSATLDMAVGSIGPTRRRCLDQLRVQLARITGDAEGSAG